MGDKSNQYWKDLFIPASGGLLTKEAILGYFHAKDQLPSQNQMQEKFRESLTKIDDSLPFHHLGTPGLISTIAGLTATSGLYLISRNSATHYINEPQYQGTLEDKQLRR